MRQGETLDHPRLVRDVPVGAQWIVVVAPLGEVTLLPFAAVDKAISSL